MEEKKAKMLKFIMGKGNQHTAERLKVQKELFGFNRVSRIFGICIQFFLLVTNIAGSSFVLTNLLSLNINHNESVNMLTNFCEICF